jgi:hypothetical protein
MIDSFIAFVALGGLLLLGSLLLLVVLGRFLVAFVQALVPLSALAIFLAILYQLLT